MIRYAIFRESIHGLKLASSNQAQFFYDSQEEAEEALAQLEPGLMELGYKGLCVRPVKCWEGTGDAVSIYA